MKQSKFKETEIGKIPEDWNAKPLSNISQITMGQSPPSSTYNVNGRGLPFFQGRKDFGQKYPSATIWCSESKRVAEKDEVLVSVRAPIGDVNIASEKCCIGRGLASLSMHKNENEFLYYLLKHAAKRLKSIYETEGTVFGCLTRDGIRNFKIPFPSKYRERRVITKILSDLDSKIELNIQINKTLESIGQAIFKHWFVDFEFPNEKGNPYRSSGGEMVDSELGDIPEEWEVREIKECGKVVCGKTPSTRHKENYGDDIAFITIPDMRDQVFVVTTERKLSHIGAESQRKKELPPLSICVSCIATPGLVSLTYERSHTNQQINSIVCSEDINPYFMYYTMVKKRGQIMTMGLGGTATLNLNTGDFSKIKVIVPDKADMLRFGKLAQPIFDRMLGNIEKNLNLSKIRDSLLPRLMSGRIRVGMNL